MFLRDGVWVAVIATPRVWVGVDPATLTPLVDPAVAYRRIVRHEVVGTLR